MIRKFKAIGLTMVAVFALTAVSASAAQAATFMSEGNVTASITADQEGTNVFSVEGSEVKCTTAHFATAGEVSSPTENIEVHPEYSGCTAFGFLSATVNTEGCNYILNANGTVTVTCSSGHVITIKGGTCEATVGSQGPLSGISYTNTSGKVKVSSNVTTIATTKTKDGIGCPFNGTGSTTGTYTGTVLAEGKHEGSAVAITVE